MAIEIKEFVGHNPKQHKDELEKNTKKNTKKQLQKKNMKSTNTEKDR